MTVDDGASVHDAHLDAALSDYDSEFSTLQLQRGWLDGKRRLNEKSIAPGGVFRVCTETARPGRKTWVGRAAEPGP